MLNGFLVVILIILSTFIAGIIYSVVQWLRNNAKPKLPFEVRIVKIRNDSRFLLKGTNFDHNRACLIAYELLNNSKRKLQSVPLKELNRITVGDIGTLTLQGTRYISFERQVTEL